MIKIYLDDQREAPEGWVRTRTAAETIEMLAKHEVFALSLDHDLEFEHYGISDTNEFSSEKMERTGYDVMMWLEQHPDRLPQSVIFHTMNPVGRARMQASLDSIRRRHGR